MSASGSTKKPPPARNGARLASPSPAAPRHPVLIALSVVGVLVLVATIGAAGLLVYGNSQIQRTAIAGIARVTGNDQAGLLTGSSGPVGQRLNLLVVGSDSRDVLTDSDRRDVAGGISDGQRADTIMLVTVDTGSSKAAVLSFPRDLLVERCDGSRGKINGAYAIGQEAGGQGGSCLVQTITQLTGVPINHYVEVDFHGFLEVVDLLGGVSLYLERPLLDPKAKLDLPAGCVTLTGPQALAFVRSRQDNDFGRIARQQRFIREMAEELSSAGTLANVPRLLPLVDSAASSVRTDAEMGLTEIRELALGLRGMQPDELEMKTVPATDENLDGVWYVVADDTKAVPLYATFRNGEILNPPPPPAPVARPTEEPLPITQVPPVAVRNGVGSPGLAATVGQRLMEVGFRVAGLSNNPQLGVSRTLVLHPPGQRAAALAVAEALGDPGVEEGAVTQVTVLVGADFAAQSAPPSEAQAVGQTELPRTFAGTVPSDQEC